MEERSVIDKIEAWLCRIPLETPIVLGGVVISERDFVIVRVRTTDGLEGYAYSLSRGAPVDITVTDLLGPILLGRDALDIPRRMDELTRGVVALGPIGVVGRAMSLLDVACVDRLFRSLWRLVGTDFRIYVEYRHTNLQTQRLPQDSGSAFLLP